jgi:CDP-glucose 4,6-dehydratase
MEELVIGRDFWAGKRVLVTGHTGFKGSWLSLWLSSLGARVSGYALAPATDPSLWPLLGIAGEVQTITADVRDLAAVNRALADVRPEIVFHLAAQSLVRASYQDPVGTYATNVMGTVHVLDAALRCPATQVVVVVTSDKCYENRESDQAYRETDPMGGRDPYSSSKGCAELVTAAYRNSFFDKRAAVASVRVGNVVGGGDWAPERLVPDLIRAAQRGDPASIRNPGATRPWQHVLEPLSGYLMLAERLSQDPAEFSGGWNFGPDEADAVPVGEVADAVVAQWGPPARWSAAPGLHPHEAHSLKLDSSKARAQLGWKPRLELRDALAWTVQWYKDQAARAHARDLCLRQIEQYGYLRAKSPGSA